MQNPHSIAVRRACRKRRTTTSGTRSCPYRCLNLPATPAIVTRTLVSLICAEPYKDDLVGFGMQEMWVLVEIMAVIVATFTLGMWLGHRIGQRDGAIKAYLNMAGTD